MVLTWYQRYRKSRRPEVVAVILNDNKTALLKSVLKTVMDPPGGLNWIVRLYYPGGNNF